MAKSESHKSEQESELGNSKNLGRSRRLIMVMASYDSAAPAAFRYVSRVRRGPDGKRNQTL